MKIAKTINPRSLDANEPTYSIGILVQTEDKMGITQIFNNVVVKPPLD
jgi:hypothetical protein